MSTKVGQVVSGFPGKLIFLVAHVASLADTFKVENTYYGQLWLALWYCLAERQYLAVNKVGGFSCSGTNVEYSLARRQHYSCYLAKQVTFRG